MQSPARSHLAALVFGLASCGDFAPESNGQGSLTPPGAPAPTMKSLSEVEPRTAVQSLAGDASAQFVINQPGSYYLTGNIPGVPGLTGIAIVSSSVKLDLNGFTVSGGGTSGPGIVLRSSLELITIENGTVRNVSALAVSASNSVTGLRIERISAVGGISLSSGTTIVRGCHVSNCGLFGGIVFSASVNDCVVEGCEVQNCSTMGIEAQTVTDCRVTTVSSSVGSGTITGIAAEVVSRCSVSGVSSASGPSIGISADTVSDSSINFISTSQGPATGITASSVQNCLVSRVDSDSSSTGIGINAATVQNCRAILINRTFASSGAIGINAPNVLNCDVQSVGATGTTSAPIGITGNVISNCHVAFIGDSGSGVGVTGIIGTAVTNCQAFTLAGGSSGNVVGISGSEVTNCVSSSLSLAGGTGTCFAISGEAISDCRIAAISSSSTGSAGGLTGYRIARNCTITGVSGAGPKFGCLSNSSGRTENININTAVDTGISVTTGQTVIGCTVTSAITGILATGTRNVIDSNNIVGSNTTTGISVTSGTNTANALVIRNQVRNCATNILADPPAQIGPVITAAGVIPAGANPWANFTD